MKKKLVRCGSDTEFYLGPKNITDEINVNLVKFEMHSRSNKLNMAKKLNFKKTMSRK